MAELKKGARITGGDRNKLAADLKRRYASGASIRDLASETGRRKVWTYLRLLRI